MKKSELIKQRTWKYFWQQKTKEVSYTLFIILGLFVIPLFLGSIIGDGYNDGCGDGFSNFEKGVEYECDKVDTWAEGFAYLLILFIIGFFGLIWLFSNWNKAEERAERDFEK